MQLPCREKYVDEAVGIYSVFGTHPNGTVDVADGQRDVFVSLPPEVAAQVIEAHDTFRHRLYELLCK